jgi:hypothetical protein
MSFLPPEDEVADRLSRERPVPQPAFRGDLRRRLTDLRSAGVGRPRHLKLLIAANASGGALLLVVALIGVLGSGPFASG